MDLNFLSLALVSLWRKMARILKLVEGLFETFQVKRDKELVRNLRATLKEAGEGGARPLNELFRELGLEE
jgi:hypothetical protein